MLTALRRDNWVPKTIEVRKKIKGPLMEYEDWWNLVVDDDGSAKLSIPGATFP
jgi:hypothetical protein